MKMLWIALLTVAISPAIGEARATAERAPAQRVTAQNMAPGQTSLKTVLAQARQRVEASDFRATGRLVHIATNGERKNYTLAMKARWFPDGLRLLFEITAPATARVRLLIEMHPGAVTVIRVAHPGDKAATTVPFARWGDGLIGTDFSYEDLMESELFWQSQSLLPDAKYGARDCFVLRSEPGASDQTHYRSATSWLDHQIEVPVHVEKTMRGSNAVKQYIYYGLRQTSGFWSASQVEARTAGGDGSSLLIIERGTATANLKLADFDPSLLTKP